MEIRPASDHSILRYAAGALAAGPLTTEDLLSRYSVDGPSLGPNGESRMAGLLDSSSQFIELDGERWASTTMLLDGITWTTRLSPDDVTKEEIVLGDDLILVAWRLLDEPARLPTGIALRVIEADDGTESLAGPPGWLAECGPGLVGVRLVGDIITVEAIGEPCEPDPSLLEALRVTFAQNAESDDTSDVLADDDRPPEPLVSMSHEDLLWEAVADFPDVFRRGPVPPLADLLAAAGLEHDGFSVAEPGFDWAARDASMADRWLASSFGLNPEQVIRFQMLSGAEIALSAGDDHPFGPPDEVEGASILLAACLHDEKVATAFWIHHRQQGAGPTRLIAFADRLLVHVSEPDLLAAGVRWLRARALDHAGQALEAERELTLAVASGADLPHAQRALAAFSADRGDARRAMSLVRQATANEADKGTAKDAGTGSGTADGKFTLLEEVTGWATHRPRPTAGRNDPCPCGSGRKYKVCHLDRELHPIVDRGGWLYAKACRYLRDGREADVAGELAHTMAGASRRGWEFGRDLQDSELVADLALCEAGIFDDFLAERHALLPDDEAMVAARWQLVERSLFEVERVEDDRLWLRDVRSGDRIVVTNVRADRRTTPGTYLIGRPLPIGETWRAYAGFVPVISLVDEALAALDERDPFELAELLGRCLALPVIQNTDGQDLAFHELLFAVGDVAAARVVLARELSDDGDGSFSLVRDSRNQRDTVIVQFRLEGDRLRVEANSDERAREAEALVGRLLPDAVLIDHDLRDFDEVMEEAQTRGPGIGPGQGDPDDDAAFPPEMIEEIARMLEARWLSEPVPALGGLTPRQAAADPVRRLDLDRLLRQFSGMPGPMDVSRLRADLAM